MRFHICLQEVQCRFGLSCYMPVPPWDTYTASPTTDGSTSYSDARQNQRTHSQSYVDVLINVHLGLDPLAVCTVNKRGPAQESVGSTKKVRLCHWRWRCQFGVKCAIPCSISIISFASRALLSLCASGFTRTTVRWHTCAVGLSNISLPACLGVSA